MNNKQDNVVGINCFFFHLPCSSVLRNELHPTMPISLAVQQKLKIDHKTSFESYRLCRNFGRTLSVPIHLLAAYQRVHECTKEHTHSTQNRLRRHLVS